MQKARRLDDDLHYLRQLRIEETRLKSSARVWWRLHFDNRKVPNLSGTFGKSRQKTVLGPTQQTSRL